MRKQLLDWYDTHRRDLPWRREPSLYKTILSEFMLQQTQVATVIPYFEKWLKRFPNLESLAKAPEESVLKHWEGLGYYNRARNLHRLAKELTKRDRLPDSLETWRELPGIGPYTAAAITSIAQNLPHPVIDGNVVRVFARLDADNIPFQNLADGQKRFQNIAQKRIDPQRPGDFNQAIMELGATICRPSKPACLICPLQSHCTAFAQKNPDAFPVILKRKIERIALNRAVIVIDNQILLAKGDPAGKRLQGILEIPTWDEIPAEFQLPESVLFKKSRGISNQRISETFYRVYPSTHQLKSILKRGHLNLYSIDQLPSLTLSGPHRKWLPKILACLKE